MSVYVIFDGKADGDQVATISGWGDFSKWADDLPVENNGQLIHLVDHGWSQLLNELETQLDAAIQKTPPPDSDTMDIANTLLRVVRERGKAEVLTMGNGVDNG